MKANGELSSVAKQEHTLKLLVNISAIITCVLLAVFFLAVIQNTALINRQVETIKEGPYPVSVAAGHIETNLVRLETIVEHLETAHFATDQAVDRKYENYFADIIGEIQEKYDTIQNCRITRSDLIEQLGKEFNLLRSRLGVFTVMCWNTEAPATVTHQQLEAYARDYVYPVIDYMLLIDNNIIETTTNSVDRMYASVKDAVSALFVVALIILVAVVAMTIIYMLLLRTKTRFENELRENLAEALRKANEANEAKSAFLSNMSHDIRTPMNAIVGLTAIADENIDDKLRVKQCLTRISTSSQHLLSLINDVLDMNKIESGKVMLAEEAFSMPRLMSEIEMIISSQPQVHRLESDIRLENIEHPLLVGDTMRLKQILLNLTSNALKYTNEGDRMEVLVRENPANQSTRSMRPGWADFTFVVADTGIGMKSAFVQRIFEPFERERNDFTIFTEGTGLGMAITKNLVELMGGTIDVASELGMGTTVTIDIPFQIAPDSAIEMFGDCHDADADALSGREGASAAMGAASSCNLRGEEADEASAASPDAAPKPTPIQVSGRVLVVEDNEINMEIAQALISARGAEVEGAYDGLEAVTTVANKPEGYYDLIFMDWQMPHMNGIEATKTLRKHFEEHGLAQTPIVAMTANAFDSDRAEALAAGMDDFMAKPINIHELEEALQRYLQPAASEGEELSGDEAARDDVAAGDVAQADAAADAVQADADAAQADAAQADAAAAQADDADAKGPRAQ